MSGKDENFDDGAVTCQLDYPLPGAWLVCLAEGWSNSRRAGSGEGEAVLCKVGMQGKENKKTLIILAETWLVCLAGTWIKRGSSGDSHLHI